LVACGLLVVQATSADAASVVLKLGHVAGMTSIHQFAATHIAERVKNYTKGEVEIQIFPSIQLGDEEEQFKAMQTGVQQMAILTLVNQSGFYLPIDVFYLPFLFQAEKQAHEVFEGPFGKKMADRFRAATGVRLLGYYEIGFRQFWTNKRAISRPADLQGIIFLANPEEPHRAGHGTRLRGHGCTNGVE
jgi:TRAP-type C4-dicarboxylate transport system substrate-binding protein